MDSTSNCSNCRFWKPRDEQPGSGKCKYGPPVWVRPNRPGDFSAAAWPTTPANEFCFRWESYVPDKVVKRGVVQEPVDSRNAQPTAIIGPPPVDEVRTTPEPVTGTPAEMVLQPVAAEPAPAPVLATNQIAQLVRGKRQPGQRME